MPILDTTGYNSANEVVNDVINAAWDLGVSKSNDYAAKVANATSGFLDIANTPTVATGTVSAPTITEPAVDIPTTQSAGDVISMFDTKYLELVQMLSDKFVAFRATYFPDESNAYIAAEDWLQAAINNPDAGLPPAIAAQIWTDDRDRLVADAARATDDVLATFATKRFPLPPGAAASATLQIQQELQDKVAESSRKVAIMSVDMQKFNVEKLLSLRQVAMGSAVDYIKALASGPDMASKLIGVGYDAQSKLISSAAQFYNARTQAAEVVTKVAQYNNSTALEAAMKNQAAELTIIEDKLKAMLAEAQALAQQATALFNNVHVSAGISNSRNTSVGFNYSNDTASAAPTTTDVW